MRNFPLCRGVAILMQCGLLLSGCGAGGALFGGYDLPESDDVANADWPSLADAPDAVGEGVYTAAAPNPVAGLLVVESLRTEAGAAALRAEELSAPILSDAEKRRLGLSVKR